MSFKKAVSALVTALLLTGMSGAWADSPALIQVLDPAGIPANRPFRVTAKVTDADGVDRVRWYFREAGSEHFAFVDLKPSNGEYTGFMPAPAATTARVEEVVLVRDKAGNLTQSKFFETPVTTPATAPATGSPLTVYSEVSPPPVSLPGFEGDYLVKGVSDSRKYGVAAGLVSAEAAKYQGEVSAPATSAEMTEKKGLSRGAMIGLAAGGVAVVALAAGGSSGGGSDSTDQTDSGITNEGDLTGTVQIRLLWYNIADVDLHVTDPCGNRIDHLLRSATCQGFTGYLDGNANDERNDGTVVTNPEENIIWEDGAPRGKYTVRVRMQDNRGQGPTLVDVTVKDGDLPIHEASTTICAEEGCDAFTTFIY